MKKIIGAAAICFAASAFVMAQTGSSTQATPPPATTPSMGHSMSTTPHAGMATAAHPMSASDCSSDGWRNYSKPTFKNESACQAWVKKHNKQPKSSSHPAPTPSSQ